MKITIIYITIIFSVIQWSFAQVPDNSLPRYGDGEKTREYIEIDHKFIRRMEKQFGSREAAAKDALELGWDYFYKGNYTDAMRRFNQSWLLDSTLLDVNCGFGAVLTARKSYHEAIDYLLICHDLNPNDTEVHKHLAISYFNEAVSHKKNGESELWPEELKSTRIYLKKYLSQNPEHAFGWGQLALAFFHENQLDSARYYGSIANEIDPRSLHPGFKKALDIE